MKKKIENDDSNDDDNDSDIHKILICTLKSFLY